MKFLKGLFNKRLLVLMLMITLSSTSILSGCEITDVFGGGDETVTVGIEATAYVNEANDVSGTAGTVEINYYSVQEGYAYEQIEVDSTASLYAEASEGYEFVGWYSHEPLTLVTTSDIYQFTVEATEDLGYYAHFAEIVEEVTYTVNFIANGGTLVDNITVTVEENTSLGEFMPYAPVREGYDFVGWSTLSTGNINFTSTSLITNDTIVYAIWEEIIVLQDYVVTLRGYTDGAYSSDGGVVQINNNSNMDNYDSITIQEGSVITITALATTGYIFIGWYATQFEGILISSSTNYTVTVPKANASYYALFERDVEYYTVTFNANGGILLGTTPVIVEENTIIGERMPYAPVREGYDFVGWSTLSTGNINFTSTSIITSDTIVYAIWEAETVLIYTRAYTDGIYSDIGGFVRASSSSSNMDTYDYANYGIGYVATIQATTNTGYEFEGWWTGSTTGILVSTQAIYSFTVETTTSLYARFTTVIQEYTVIFDVQGGGSPVETVSILGGTALGENMPANPIGMGVVFVEWRTGLSGTGLIFDATTIITGNITVYAVWEQEIYTVVFESQGGTPVASITFEGYGVSLGEDMPASPVKMGFDFVEWNTSYDGNAMQVISSTMLFGDMVVYAIWEEEIVYYTATARAYTDGIYTDIGGTVQINSSTNQDNYDSAVVPEQSMVVMTASSQPGYVFVGWFTTSEGTILVNESINYVFPIMQHTSLYAIFETDVAYISIITIAYTNDVYGGEGGIVKINGSINSDFYDVKEALVTEAITIQAIANSGFTFIGWYADPVGGVLISASTEYVFIATIAVDYYALFETEVITYEVSIQADDGMGPCPYCTVDMLINGENTDSDYSQETQSFTPGTMVIVEAIPTPEYIFQGWYTMDNVLVSTETIYVFDIIEDTSLKAVFTIDPMFMSM